MYRYKISSTGNSSHKFGPCEICKEHVSEVFLQIEERQYLYDEGHFDIEDMLEDPRVYQGGYRHGDKKWTQNKCFSYFGHKECLESKRRGEYTVIEEGQDENS